jgi:hypothetical protein
MLEIFPASCCPTAANGSIAAAVPHLTGNGSTRLCLHPGTHTLTEPILLSAAHSNSRWTTCKSSDPSARAVISGGLHIPTTAWQRWQPRSNIWVTQLPSRLEHSDAVGRWRPCKPDCCKRVSAAG